MIPALLPLTGLGTPSCEVLRLGAADEHALVAFAEAWIPVGSLLRPAGQGSCELGRALELVALGPYRQVERPLAEPGHVGCLDESALVGINGMGWMAPGQLAPLPISAGPLGCEAELVGPPIWSEGMVLPLELWERGQRASRIVGLPVVLSDWGRAALPMRRWSEAELQAHHRAEGLDSPERRERAITAEGESWLHFDGADPAGSDAWATPQTLRRFMDLARGWERRCTADLGLSRQRCLLRVGDLSWYSPLRPDPLGHKEHFEGRCADLRLFRNDESLYEAWWNRPDDRPGVKGGYDRELNRAFLRYAVEEHEAGPVHFNDPELLRDPALLDRVTWYKGHDDHIHLCL